MAERTARAAARGAGGTVPLGSRTFAAWPLVPTRSFDEPLTWLLPDELVADGEVAVGSLVEVPVGGSARVAVVAEVDVPAPAGVQLRPATRLLDLPAVPAPLVALAAWIADQYGCAKTVAMALVVPPKLAAHARAAEVPRRTRQQAVRRLELEVEGLDLTRRQRELAARLPLAWVSVANACEHLSTTRATLGKLAEAGVLRLEQRFLDELEEGDAALREAAAAAARGEDGDGGSGSAAAAAALPGDAATDTAPEPEVDEPVELTPAQLEALAVCEAGDGPAPATVLQGITGSGKTEVYLELIEHALAGGRGAIVLVPEIALTPQVAGRFVRRFPGSVEVLHSALTRAQRHEAWLRIAAGAARVVVGPRSAVFAPVRDLGVIVIDEEHDGSYKQDSEPRYDARRVAWKRAALEGGRVVYGSATPRPESWHGVPRRAHLLERPAGGRLAPVELLDRRRHEDEVPLSKPVREALRATMARGRKAIVLQNRRGFAPALHCRDCGKPFRCPHCDISLVVHGRVARRQRLDCHHCGHHEPVPRACPDCGAGDIVRLGAGTEQVEQLLQEVVDEPVHRLDADAVRTRGAVADILGRFGEPGPGVLVGTQMVAKGHDFPDVELAVVVDADAAMAIPDFRSEERAFALVAQLAGRAGRSAHTAEHARVLVQTWDPEQEFLQLAKEHDVDGFLQRELERREQVGWPPFTRLVRVMVSAPRALDRDRWIEAAAEGLHAMRAGTVLGPAELVRLGDRERAHVLVRTHRAPEVAAAVRRFLGTSEAQRRKSDVRLLLDVDPQSLL